MNARLSLGNQSDNVVDKEQTPAPWTVGRVLEWATRDFAGRNFDSPRLDAELLLSHTLGLDRIRLILEAERPLTNDELGQYRALIQRRRQAEPIAYILGRREFYGLNFRVNAEVLIPRPDTETLVEVALERTQSVHLNGRALDLCCGSGCVAIAFAKARPTWQVLGTDISPGAIRTAQDNAQRLGVIHNTSFLKSDLFDAFAKATPPFNLITCNPPYIKTDEIPKLAADIHKHEPVLALDGGQGGLDFYRRIIRELRPWLAEGGLVAFEVGAEQADDVHALMAKKGFVNIERKRDYGGHERVLSGQRPDVS